MPDINIETKDLIELNKVLSYYIEYKKGDLPPMKIVPLLSLRDRIQRIINYY